MASSHQIIAVVGTTASGKTALAIDLAEALGAEILSADSQAVYRHMDIGTAKPTIQEQRRAKFHLLDVVEPNQNFNAASWCKLARPIIEGAVETDKPIIICGGTGLYIRALLEGYRLGETPRNDGVRNRLESECAQLGGSALYRRLENIDPITASRLHPNDHIRIVRALEVYEVTGETLSARMLREQASRKQIPALKIGLFAEREVENRRIDHRVDEMMSAGFLLEVKGLIESGLTDDLAAMRSLGYRELCAFLREEIDLEFAVSEIKRNTRRYARRQSIWFRADKEIQWIDTTNLACSELKKQAIAILDQVVVST